MADPTTYRRPESVLIVVYTPRGDVLLLRRQKPLSFWQSVTGSLEPGETHADAAVRELAEETGIGTVDELRFTSTVREFEIDPRWRHRYAPGVTRNTEYEWRLRVDTPRAVSIDGDEHSAFCWMPVQYAADAVWSWTNKEALQALREDLLVAA